MHETEKKRTTTLPQAKDRTTRQIAQRRCEGKSKCDKERGRDEGRKGREAVRERGRERGSNVGAQQVEKYF